MLKQNLSSKVRVRELHGAKMRRDCEGEKGDLSRTTSSPTFETAWSLESEAREEKRGTNSKVDDSRSPPKSVAASIYP